MREMREGPFGFWLLLKGYSGMIHSWPRVFNKGTRTFSIDLISNFIVKKLCSVYELLLVFLSERTASI